MTEFEFNYADYIETRNNLITQVNNSLTAEDKDFIISFEEGSPNWDKCYAGDLSNFPSIKWKLQNIIKLKESNPQKHQQGIEKLKQFFRLTT